MRILIIEDDEKLSKRMKQQLEQAGYEADVCASGGDIWYYLSPGYELLILDRMLPERDGMSILAELRQHNITIPVILVTALGTLENRVEGLDQGADDYLVKPFAFEELNARIRALLRRPPALSKEGEALSFSDLTLSPLKRTLSVAATCCELSKKEYELMESFLRHPNQTLTRELLMTSVWGVEADVTDGNLDNYISFLRRRLRTLHSHVQIKTVHAIGYRLEDLS